MHHFRERGVEPDAASWSATYDGANMTVDRVSHAARRRRFEWLTLAAISLLVLACTGYIQAEARARALRQQAEQLQVQARVVGENVLLQVNGVDQALASVRDDFLRKPPSPEALRSAQQRFRALAAALPGVRAILVLDAKGNVLAATRDELVGMKFSGRDYFVRVRNRPDRGVLYVSKPFETSESEWVMPVSRALLDENGAFAGVIVAGLDSRYMAVVLRSVLYARDMTATLAHGDGDLFIRVAAAMPDLRRPARGDGLLAGGRPTRPTDEPDLRDGPGSTETRLVVSRVIEDPETSIRPPMVVEVTRAMDSILVGWRHDNAVLAAMLALSGALSAIGLGMLQRRRAEISALAYKTRSLQEESTRRIRTITDSLPALVAYIDRDHRYRFVNARYRTFYALDPEMIVGRRMADVIGEDAYAVFGTKIDAVLNGEGQHFQQHGVAGKEDVYFNIDFIPDTDPDGHVAGFYVMVMDITALKLAEQKLAALALFDTLTGLANRHQFTERLKNLLAKPDDPLAPVTLMFLDVDRFKSINDNLGHAAGDAVLREFAHRLADAVRPTDVVARLAGDEFVVILEGLRDKESVCAVAQKVLAAIAVQFDVEGRALSVSTSIGIACAAAHETSPAELLAAADGALYEAKARGRGNFVISSQCKDRH